MHVLVLHSEVEPDAPPEEMDTLIAARAVAEALRARGHTADLAAFVESMAGLLALLAEYRTEAVFNLVEGLDGQGRFACIAPLLLARIGVSYTGTNAAGLIATQDKPLTKRTMRAAGIATPDWAEPPDWRGLDARHRYIVKRADEDSSIGLDDACVVAAAEVPARAEASRLRWGGAWFAERFVEGREFNVGVLSRGGEPYVLPMAEMLFEDWPADSPRIVGYAAKWDEESRESRHTVRKFGIELHESALATALAGSACDLWRLFDLAGFARVDYRVDAEGKPQVLEVNPNPCIAPDGGFAVAAAEAGLSYSELIECLVLECF
jgi:D-alanine-D-alanine ligase